MKLLLILAVAGRLGAQVSLFDGATAGGWQAIEGAFPSSAWTIEDGCWRAAGGSARSLADILTSERFRNFDLSFEWKVAPGVNSGVKYLVVGQRPESVGTDRPKVLGFELQLIDDSRIPDSSKKPTNITGALYSYLAPTATPALAPGEWNIGRIVVNGNAVEHWINNRLVLSYRLDSPELRSAITTADRGVRSLKTEHLDRILANPEAGYPIALTHHGDGAWFRSIRIKRLPRP